MRSRIRRFMWQALERLAARDDVEAIVINAHSQGTVIALDVLEGLDDSLTEMVRLLITAGSPLRKYVDLFAWGTQIYRDNPQPWLQNWFNFWDDADPAADPLRPGPTWKAGSCANVPVADPTLYQSVDSNGGAAVDVMVKDRQVDNTTNSPPVALRAHNYWDNHAEFTSSIPELFH